MKNNNVYHRHNIFILIILSILLSTTIFPQQYKTKYDTVDCSKYSCEQWGVKNESCRDLDLEQWPAHCASCRQLSLFLQDKFDELDYGIYSNVLSCTIHELECELAQELGYIPSMRGESIYHKNGFSTENKTYQDYVYKYKISNGWAGDTFIFYKIIVDKPQGEVYAHVKIGSGKCGIKKKIRYVDNGYDDSVPGLSVGISGGETPIATAQMLMDKLSSLLQSNYEIARSHIYNQLNNATNGWTEEKKQGAIHSIKWNYSDSRMAVGKCEDDYFGKLDNLIQAEIMVELDEPILPIEESLIDESDKITEELGEIYKIGEDSIGVVTTGNTPNNEEVLKKIVCASAKPSFTEGSKFKRAKFTIGGTEPQRIKITSSAENFAIKKEYGGLVYQVIDGISWGNLTLEPDTYILSCSGGGAMGLMSATVCIENPMAGQVPPSSDQTVTHSGDYTTLPELENKENQPIEIIKPSLPWGPVEQIIIRAQGNTATELYIKKGKKTSIVIAWGVDAAGHKIGGLIADEWKLSEQSDKSIGSINSKTGEFKTGLKDGMVKIIAMFKNKEDKLITGTFSIIVSMEPPITFKGKVELYDENHSALKNLGGVLVDGHIDFWENKHAFNKYPYHSKAFPVRTRTKANGDFKFTVPDKFKGFDYLGGWHIEIDAPTRKLNPGYVWWDFNPLITNIRVRTNTSGGPGPLPKTSNVIQLKANDTPSGALTLWMKPAHFVIDGKVIHRGKIVRSAKVSLVDKTSDSKEYSYSDKNGYYKLWVDGLPNGRYSLKVNGWPPDVSQTVHNLLWMKKNISVDLPLQTQKKTINIELISFGEKIGYTGP